MAGTLPLKYIQKPKYKKKFGVMAKAQGRHFLDEGTERARQERSAMIIENRNLTMSLARRIKRDSLRGVDTTLFLGLGQVVNVFNTNAAAFGLNNTQVGPAYYNRLGDKIRLKSLRIVIYGQCALVQSAGGDLPSNTFRMVVIRHRSPNGQAIPVFNTIFGKTDDAGGQTTSLLDKVFFEKTSEYQILCDRTICLNPTAGTNNPVDVQAVEFHLDEYINLRGMETQYKSNTNPAVYTDILTGGILVYFRANANVTADSECGVTNRSFARLRFYA